MHPVVDHDQSQTVKLTFHLQTTHSNTLKTIVRNYTTRIPNIHLTVKKNMNSTSGGQVSLKNSKFK